MSFSPMQQEYFRESYHRWNVKSGATRSGKTYMDYFLIPKRIRAVAGNEGLDNYNIAFATVGVDFGGGSSAHAFNCTAFTRGMREIITIHDYRRKDAATPQQLYDDLGKFLAECRLIANGRFSITDMYCDSAEQTLIGGIRAEAARNGWKINVHNAKKKEINDRIRFYCIMQGAGRYKIHKSCTATIDAFSEAMWDGNETADVRLDDGTTNIDNLDAQEYSTEPYMKDILNMR